MKIKHVLLLSSMYAASAVHADGFYALGAVGQSHFEGSRSAAEDALASDGALIGADTTATPTRFDNNDTGYKLQLGYKFNQNFAVEGGYVDLGQQHYHADFNGGVASAKVDARGWNIDALGMLPVAGQFSAFGKVGVVDAQVRYHISGVSDDGSFADTREKYRVSPNFGVGGEYSINDDTAVRLELERFADLGKKSTTGEQNVDLVSLGVAYHFS